MVFCWTNTVTAVVLLYNTLAHLTDTFAAYFNNMITAIEKVFINSFFWHLHLQHLKNRGVFMLKKKGGGGGKEKVVYFVAKM